MHSIERARLRTPRGDHLRLVDEAASSFDRSRYPEFVQRRDSVASGTVKGTLNSADQSSNSAY
jgi:hypothetical protein